MEKQEYTRTGRQVTLADKVVDKMVKGVAVITTKSGEKVNGMAASWFIRVSEVPCLLMVSVWKENYSHDLIKRSGIFAVNVMAKGQVETVRHFGRQSGRDTNKFLNADYEIRKTGSPILKDCLAFLDCKVYSSLEAGDHTIFVGEVLDSGFQRDGEPLVYDRKDYPYLTGEELKNLSGAAK
jgi:flavin reductase (DIM6/NTAB) family NADH-FMN oxidoreductase RutF